jgi:hypothetical protein
LNERTILQGLTHVFMRLHSLQMDRVLWMLRAKREKSTDITVGL